MKTFFLALILGIFIGALATAYFSSPNAYQKLVEAKTRLLKHPTQAPSEPPAPVPPEDDQTGDADPETTGEGPAEVPEPEPTDPVKKESPAPIDEETPTSETEPTSPTPTSEPTPPAPEQPAEATSESLLEAEPDPAIPTPADTEDGKPVPSEASPKEPVNDSESSDDPPTPTENEDAPAPKPEATSPDLALAAAIKKRFEAEEQINAEAISILVDDRSVILEGPVPNAQVKQLAIEIAIATEGVSQVTSKLEITDAP